MIKILLKRVTKTKMNQILKVMAKKLTIQNNKTIVFKTHQPSPNAKNNNLECFKNVIKNSMTNQFVLEMETRLHLQDAEDYRLLDQPRQDVNYKEDISLPLDVGVVNLHYLVYLLLHVSVKVLLLFFQQRLLLETFKLYLNLQEKVYRRLDMLKVSIFK